MAAMASCTEIDPSATSGETEKTETYYKTIGVKSYESIGPILVAIGKMSDALSTRDNDYNKKDKKYREILAVLTDGEKRRAYDISIGAATLRDYHIMYDYLKSLGIQMFDHVDSARRIVCEIQKIANKIGQTEQTEEQKDLRDQISNLKKCANTLLDERGLACFEDYEKKGYFFD